MIVDDEEDAHFLMNRAFLKADFPFTLIHLYGGDQAIEHLAEAAFNSERLSEALPALVLLDLKMPVKTGFKVLEFIQTLPALRDIPVIVLSCSSLKFDVTLAYSLRCHSYVRKPMEFDHLKGLIVAIGNEFFPNMVTHVPVNHSSKLFSTFVTSRFEPV